MLSLPRCDECLRLLLQWLYGLLWMLLFVLFGSDDDGEGRDLRAEALSALGAELKCWRATGRWVAGRMQDVGCRM